MEQIRPTPLGPIATYKAALGQMSLVEDDSVVFREDVIGCVAVGRVRERKAARELLENSVDDLCREIRNLAVTWVLDHREGFAIDDDPRPETAMRSIEMRSSTTQVTDVVATGYHSSLTDIQLAGLLETYCRLDLVGV